MKKKNGRNDTTQKLKDQQRILRWLLVFDFADHGVGINSEMYAVHISVQIIKFFHSSFEMSPFKYDFFEIKYHKKELKSN